ncbi:MAG: chorismate-binding protein [Luteolibacter sp.]
MPAPTYRRKFCRAGMENQQAAMAWLARRDGSLLLGHGPFQQVADPPAGELAFYVSDFALTEPRPWRIPARWEQLEAAELAQRLPRDGSGKCQFQQPDATPFSAVFQEVMASIQAGQFEKTVPVVTEEGEASTPPARWVAHAMARCRLPLMSYAWLGEGQGFAGATPELLFTLDAGRLETMALAGTARSEDEDVFAVDEKEIREHEYVAQSLMAKLVDLGTPERSPRNILNLGSIVHFHTELQLHLNQVVEPAAWIRRLHPTPALGPLPRNEATMRQLMEWRHRLGCPAEFGAPFGVIAPDGRFDAVVAIRGIWWKRNTIRIPSGCGIIEASRLVNEWRELRLKREAVKLPLIAAYG